MKYSTAKRVRRLGAAAVLGGAALIVASLYKGEHVPEALAAGAGLAGAGAAARYSARRAYERDPSNWGWAPRFGMNYYDINKLGTAAVLGGTGALATGLYIPEAAAAGTSVGLALIGTGIAFHVRGAQLRKQDEKALDAYLDRLSGTMKRQKVWRESRQARGSQ